MFTLWEYFEFISTTDRFQKNQRKA